MALTLSLEDVVQYVAGIETRWYDAPFAIVRAAPSIEAPDAWDIVTAGQGAINNWTVWRELDGAGGSYIYGEC